MLWAPLQWQARRSAATRERCIGHRARQVDLMNAPPGELGCEGASDFIQKNKASLQRRQRGNTTEFVEHENGRRPSRQSRPCHRRRTCNIFSQLTLQVTRCHVLAFCALNAAKAKVKPRPTQKARRFDQLSLHAASGLACFGHRGTTILPVDR